MSKPEALILRRCYPVPVTFADLREARSLLSERFSLLCSHLQFIMDYKLSMGVDWTSCLKQATGALDEVYAVVDGREVRVAAVDSGAHPASWRWFSGDARILPSKVSELLNKADCDGYWSRPHEVRLRIE